MKRVELIRTEFLSRRFLWSDTAILVYLALAKLAIHLLTAVGYGYFGDELYWLDMARHPDFGYVDVPPLTAYLGVAVRFLFGTSQFGIRVLPAIAGALVVLFAGLLARELGGGRFAQGLSALAALVTPYLLYVNSVFTYDGFEQLAAILLYYLTVRIINEETPKRWLLLGLAAGLGALTKLIIIYTGAALVVSLLLTPRRKSFLTPWPWLAALIAALVCTPFLAWQSVHDWPLLSYFHHYALDPLRPHQNPVQFFMSLFFYHVNPFFLPVWLLGLVFVLFHRDGKKFRILGFTALILAVSYTGLFRLEAREMVSACFPILAAGAVGLEKLMTAAANRKLCTRLTGAYAGLILAGAALLAPISLPILPVVVLERYWAAVPAFIRDGDYSPGVLPQHFRFSIGWPEIVREIASVYESLPEDDRKNCAVWTGFYWNAAAVDLLGKEYGLPEAVSNCLSFQVWGEERFKAGDIPETMIMLDDRAPFPAPFYFPYFVQAGTFYTNPYGIYAKIPLSVYVCRNPKADFPEAWKNNAYYY